MTKRQKNNRNRNNTNHFQLDEEENQSLTLSLYPGEENHHFQLDGEENHHFQLDGEENQSLTLSLSPPRTRRRTEPSLLPAALSPPLATSRFNPPSNPNYMLPPPQQNAGSFYHQNPIQPLPAAAISIPAQPQPRPQQNVGPPQRRRRNPNQGLRDGHNKHVDAPFRWATTRRAMVYSLNHLISEGITTISGDVQCKHCNRVFKIEYDLVEKFDEVRNFISMNKDNMHDRAPGVWMSPVLPTCKECEKEKILNSLRPIMANKKRAINWLFLLLGQMLGCCTLEQLKYFCKHTNSHRTGAKDRVLYLAYLGLCKQLDPTGPFDR